MADEPNREQLQLLLDLQETDGKLRRIEHQLEHLDEQKRLDEAKEELKANREQQADLRVEIDRVDKESSKVEGEMDLLQQRRDAEQSRLYGGKIHTAREMKSLEAEIEATDRRISQDEDQVLELLEKAEELDSQLTTLADQAEQLQQRIEELTAARDEAAQGLLAEKAELEVLHDDQRQALDDEFLERYDEVVGRTSGKAVGELADGQCTACGIQLPVAEANELYDGPPLTVCPCSQRKLLVVPQ